MKFVVPPDMSGFSRSKQMLGNVSHREQHLYNTRELCVKAATRAQIAARWAWTMAGSGRAIAK